MKTPNERLPKKESQEVEFKTSFGEEVIISLVAFANSYGGSVYVGLSDSGEVKGLQIGKEAIAKWLNEIKNKTVPSIIPDVKIVQHKNMNIAVFSVSEFPINLLQ